MAKGGIPADALAGIRAVFFEECEEHLAELERGLEALARGRLAWFQRGYRRRTAKLTRIDRDDPPRWTH